MKRTRPEPRPGARAGTVRIIGGRWRGTRLPVADVEGLRPTPDRVRETLFNWLQPVLPGARVLDLFAGSGALGLEALSRGAREALLVERDPALAEALHQVVARLHAEGEATVARADVQSMLRAPLQGRFDVVFLDPPFAGDHWLEVLRLLPPWLTDDAWLYLEAPATSAVEAGPEWTPHREGRTRDVHYRLFRRAGRAATAAATLPAGTASDDTPRP